MLKNVSQSGKGVKSLGQVCSGICPSACLGELVQQASPSRSSNMFVQVSAQAGLLTVETLNNSELLEAI